MNKIFASMVVALPLLFLGCAPQQPKAPTDTTSKYGRSQSGQSVAQTGSVSTSTQDVEMVDSGASAYARICEGLSVAECRFKADNYYSRGDFKSAIYAYDANCGKQDIPSCLKMARMFEKGEGARINLANALDIYERACYSGHAPSCKEVKRLQK